MLPLDLEANDKFQVEHNKGMDTIREAKQRICRAYADLKLAYTAMCRKDEAHEENVRQLTDRLAAYRAELRLHRQKAKDEYWVWQGDGTDEIDSITCPVLITATSLHGMLEEIKELRRKLAEAGIEGSPPPGRDTAIGTLQNKNIELRNLLKRWIAIPRPTVLHDDTMRAIE